MEPRQFVLLGDPESAIIWKAFREYAQGCGDPSLTRKVEQRTSNAEPPPESMFEDLSRAWGQDMTPVVWRYALRLQPQHDRAVFRRQLRHHLWRLLIVGLPHRHSQTHG